MFRFLNPNHMADQLQLGQVPPAVQLTLISLIITIQCLFGRPGLIGPLGSASSLPFAAFQLCMVLVTLFLAYRANGASSGKDFITRYAMLACVLLFWIYVIGYIAYIGTYLALYTVQGPPVVELFRMYGPAQLVFSAATALAFLISLQHFMVRVSRAA